MMSNAHKTSIVEHYAVDVANFDVQEMTLSDAKFLWSIEGQGGKREFYHPNPSRIYGLYRDSLQVYVEAYVPEDIAAAGPLDFETVILDGAGEKVKRSRVAVATPEGVEAAGSGQTSPIRLYKLVLTEDLNRFPAGRYSARPPIEPSSS